MVLIHIHRCKTWWLSISFNHAIFAVAVAVLVGLPSLWESHAKSLWKKVQSRNKFFFSWKQPLEYLLLGNSQQWNSRSPLFFLNKRTFWDFGRRGHFYLPKNGCHVCPIFYLPSQLISQPYFICMYQWPQQLFLYEMFLSPLAQCAWASHSEFCRLTQAASCFYM